jgi:hypothetical protein
MDTDEHGFRESGPGEFVFQKPKVWNLPRVKLEWDWAIQSGGVHGPTGVEAGHGLHEKPGKQSF